MAKNLSADGDTWRARLGLEVPREGMRTVLFFCTSNGQRPYRVVEVPGEQVPDAGALDGIGDSQLAELFARSVSMGVPAT